MESWNYASEGKGILLPETELAMDALMRSRKAFLGWDCSSSCNLENEFIADGEGVGGMEYTEFGVPDSMKNYLTCSLGVRTASCESISDFSRKVVSPTRMVSSSSSLGEEESGSKFSSSFLEDNSQDSSLIDLKLGRQANCKESLNVNENLVVSPAGASSLTKRTRATVSYSQTPTCQVYGCNMDLSSSKDYHKRHRVCDAHSKTPKVIVNGVEQRFCQQCSRFHLLGEFDDTKRSCRRRLAGHNERRRKPQLDTISGRPQKLLQCYPGTRFLGASLANGSPIVFSNVASGGIFYPGKSEQANQFGNVKLLQDPASNPQLLDPLSNGQQLLKSFCPNDHGKQFSSIVTSTATGNHAILDRALNVRKLSRVSNSSCARSLLSADSEILSSQSARVAASSPLTIRGSQTQCRDQANGKYTGVGLNSDGSFSSGTNYMEVDRMGSVVLSDASHRVDIKVEPGEAFQGSDLLTAKYCFPPEDGFTVDLLQLSSHLQRVEQERNFTPEKQEDNDFWFPRDLG